ncbi:MAG: N-glycosylase/DNA lyase [Sulfurihydrogenibium sp.]|uniref:8-oxoguanine DNA glycosylase/AP lyase n=1 Tax=Sulfurihydrogenibium azorense TaxID=309806 RepID=A0A831YDB4_9AQUI|nr:MAG: N-glycosylase [Sulfurihydrogenibium sp.]PMP77130.1 MAG: N-glycosylase [Sulfurihydrogenibium sp.]HEV08999.1 N-glycosylase/DNA lyase [Sulfurihydrogenibium azorense]
MIPPKEAIEKAIAEVSDKVNERIKQFKNLKKENITTFDFKPFLDVKPYKADVFSEACFCILTANFKASTGIKIQAEVGIEGFKSYPLEKLYEIISSHGHRFAMQRAERIVALRDLEDFLLDVAKENDGKKVREELVKNIKGYGYKEASHFLRNIGFDDVAIIDRHISRFLFETGLVKPRKTITKKVYLECEEALEKICQDLNLTQAELDLYIFYIKTKKVLK